MYLALIYQTMTESCNEWVCAEQGTSTLLVEGVPGGINFSLEVHEGHVCSIEGFAYNQAEENIFEHTRVFSEEHFDSAPTLCRLTITQNPDGTVVVQDENNNCKSYTCGPAATYNKEFMVVESL